MQFHCRGQEVLPSTCPRQRRRPQQVPQVFATGNIVTKFGDETTQAGLSSSEFG